VNREQFKEFVTTVINADPSWENEYSVWEDTVERIVGQWESDVNDARIAGQDEGRQEEHEYTNGMREPCMGLCCGGGI
jgi:hypothetical protein